MALFPGGFAEDAVCFQLGDILPRGSKRYLQHFLRMCDGDDGGCKQFIDQREDRGGVRLGLQTLPIGLPKIEQAFGAFDSVACLLGNTLSKEVNPIEPGALLTDREHQSTVLVVVAFQVSAEIEQRLGQASAFAEHQRDEQATYSAVAVHKRVDRFKLIMNQSKLHDQ